MGWLARLSFGKGGTALAEAEREDADSTPQTTGPQLMVLVRSRPTYLMTSSRRLNGSATGSQWMPRSE